MKKLRHRIALLFISLAILFVVSAFADLEVHFLDVGQGDCTIVICDGEAMIVDGGPPSASQYVYNYVRETLSLSSVRYLVSTHPHDDHAGGLPAVLNAVQVDAVMSPVLSWDSRIFSSMLQYADLQGAPVFTPDECDVYSLGGADVEILSCYPDAWTTNDMSICLRIRYGDISIILMADAEYMTEYTLLTYYPDLRATVLKASHHGSNTSSTLDFVSAVAPEYVVISCGRANTFGHPNREVLDAYASIGSQLFRTDLQGTIIMRSDGKTIDWSTEQNATEAELFTAPFDQRYVDVRTFIDDEEIAYVGNSHTLRFHNPDCPSVIEMKPENRVTFSTREEAIEQGYQPCGRCNP